MNKRIGPKLIPMIMLGLLLPIVSWAYNANYGPFADDTLPKQIKLIQLKPILDELTATRTCTIPGEPSLSLELSGGEEPQQIVVKNDNTVVFPKTQFTKYGSDWATKVYAAKLNEDTQRDFVLISHSFGTGLAGEKGQVAFLLSEGNTYTLNTVNTIFADENDFILLEDQRCFIQSSLQNVEQCSDGKKHNFWVYQLLSFKGGKLEKIDTPDDMFPKIVWYSSAPNHTESILLDADAKEIVLKSAREAMFWANNKKAPAKPRL